MKEEFTYYKVQWIEENATGLWYKNEKILYFKKGALEYKELIDKSERAKKCIIKEITEITEIIS